MRTHLFAFCIVCFFFLNQETSAQKKPLFIGINPSLTIEKDYDRGEYDINILPLVFQIPLNERLDLRFTTIYNYGIRNYGNRFFHAGLETALPVFFKEKSADSPSEGFYVAPILSLSRNRFDKYYNSGIWFEPGYMFLIGKKMGLSLGVQFGATYFSHKHNRDIIKSHFGLKVILGGWL